MTKKTREKEKAICPKTLSGKHKWLKEETKICAGFEHYHYISLPKRCEYCKIIDDRE